MSDTVFIPTRERRHLLEKALPKWAEQTVDVVLVVAPAEAEVTNQFVEENDFDVEVFVTTADNVGIGAIREEVLVEAERRGLDSFIMSDDDLYPSDSYDITELLDVVIEEDIVGCGAANSYHGLLLGNNDIPKSGLYFPIAGGFGHRVFGINTALARESGGYPVWATCFGDDVELQRQSVAIERPWFLNTAVHFTSVGKRYSPGGVDALFGGDLERRMAEEFKVNMKMYELWPDYVNDPRAGGKYRMKWQKMMNDYIPDWRDRVPSAIKEMGYGA